MRSEVGMFYSCCVVALNLRCSCILSSFKFSLRGSLLSAFCHRVIVFQFPLRLLRQNFCSICSSVAIPCSAFKLEVQTIFSLSLSLNHIHSLSLLSSALSIPSFVRRAALSLSLSLSPFLSLSHSLNDVVATSLFFSLNALQIVSGSLNRSDFPPKISNKDFGCSHRRQKSFSQSFNKSNS